MADAKSSNFTSAFGAQPTDRLRASRPDWVRAPSERRGEAPALDAEDLVSYRRLAAREDPFGLAAWRRKLANRDGDGAKR